MKSRFIPEIIRAFDESTFLENRASQDDIERYIEGHIGQLSAFAEWSRRLQNEIKTGISEAADGVYVYFYR